MTSFANHLLIAMPAMQDPAFARTVIYIFEHNKDGAMGVVINTPIEMNLKEMVEQAAPGSEVNDTKGEQIIVKGGPVSPDRGFILHYPHGEWEGSMRLNDEFTVTTSKDIVACIGNQHGPEKQVIALGYAGWSPGQLEEELTDNAWLMIPATHELVFDTPLHDRWSQSIKALGIEPWQLTEHAGHA